MSTQYHLELPGAGAHWTDHKGRPYFPSAALVQAANAALLLDRPLLVMGEPGCGKTSLAGAIRNELSRLSEADGNAPWAFREWHVKSTQQARDGLYIYDLVGRLRDSQLLANNAVKDEDHREKLMQMESVDYVKMNALGKAFQSSDPTVLLIDEIDKADRDFPNDLLLELDEKRFRVEELSEEEGGDFIRSEAPLLTIITSNSERELPEPFLRRCVFFYIEFPDSDLLSTILGKHLESKHPDVLPTVQSRFEELRRRMVAERDLGEPVKPPSTSELIDWAKVLRRHKDDEILQQLEGGKIPYAEVLIKQWADHRFLISGKSS